MSESWRGVQQYPVKAGTLPDVHALAKGDRTAHWVQTLAAHRRADSCGETGTFRGTGPVIV